MPRQRSRYLAGLQAIASPGCDGASTPYCPGDTSGLLHLLRRNFVDRFGHMLPQKGGQLGKGDGLNQQTCYAQARIGLEEQPLIHPGTAPEVQRLTTHGHGPTLRTPAHCKSCHYNLGLVEWNHLGRQGHSSLRSTQRLLGSTGAEPKGLSQSLRGIPCLAPPPAADRRIVPERNFFSQREPLHRQINRLRLSYPQI